MAEEKTPEETQKEKKVEEEKKAAAPPPPPPPSAPSAPEDKASGKAIAALVLGILGILCCAPLGPVAWIIGAQERKAIAQGQSSEKGQTLATVGWVLGIIGTVFLILWILWVIFMGGLSIIANLSGGGY